MDQQPVFPLSNASGAGKPRDTRFVRRIFDNFRIFRIFLFLFLFFYFHVYENFQTTFVFYRDF